VEAPSETPNSATLIQNLVLAPLGSLSGSDQITVPVGN
jgi:hypothetical protein